MPVPPRFSACTVGRAIPRASLVLIALAAALPAFAQTPAPAGDVTALKGEGVAETASARRPLSQGEKVFVAETVGTGAGSRMTLALGKNTTIKLGEKVRMKIEKHLVDAGGTFDLQSGAALFDRGVGAPKGETTFRSPYGLLAVRGTKFFAGPSKGVFGVFVVHGRVDVTAGGRTVRLTKGLGTDIKSPGAAPTPAASWKPPRIRAALRSVE